jgi:hypothetical protein
MMRMTIKMLTPNETELRFRWKLKLFNVELTRESWTSLWLSTWILLSTFRSGSLKENEQGSMKAKNPNI